MERLLSGIDMFKKALVGAVIAASLFWGPAATGFAAENYQEKCPIMGYRINKNVYADHNRNRVYFCCASCIDKFKKDPEGYLKKMKEAGVVPDEVPEAKD